MNTIIHRIRRAILATSILLLIPFLMASNADPLVEIQNEGELIKTISAKPFIKRNVYWLKIKMDRNEFTAFPDDSHLHIEIYDESSNLLKADYRKLSKLDFHHTRRGRRRDNSLLYNTEFKPTDVFRIVIKTHEQGHDNINPKRNEPKN